MTLRAFGPLLRPGGWLLVVASSFGILAWYDDPVALTDEPVRQDPGRFSRS